MVDVLGNLKAGYGNLKAGYGNLQAGLGIGAGQQSNRFLLPGVLSCGSS